MKLTDDNTLDAIDTLASEYGWTIEYIQQLQVSEVNALVARIVKRRKFEWRMQCYIVNCAQAGKNPSFDDEKPSNGDENMPEDVQLVKLSQELGLDLKKE